MNFKKLKELEFSLKMSFEDEGLTHSQAINFASLANSNGVETVLKIGGAEAITDMRMAYQLGCVGCVAPMIESDFALQKFINAVKLNNFNFKNLYINIESSQAVENINKILNHTSSKHLKGIVLGRSDLISSLGLTKDKTDSDEILKIATSIFELAKKNGLETLMGGNLNINSYDFIRQLHDKNLIDYIETRNVKMKCDKVLGNFKDALDTSIQFEIEWLKLKNLESKLLLDKDFSRISNLTLRKT